MNPNTCGTRNLVVSLVRDLSLALRAFNHVGWYTERHEAPASARADTHEYVYDRSQCTMCARLTQY